MPSNVFLGGNMMINQRDPNGSWLKMHWFLGIAPLHYSKVVAGLPNEPSAQIRRQPFSHSHHWV